MQEAMDARCSDSARGQLADAGQLGHGPADRLGYWSARIRPAPGRLMTPRAGRLVFDINSERFSEQWRRFDWGLLLNSNVHRVDRRDLFEGGLQKLIDLGYRVHRTSAADWTTAREVHDELATLFDSFRWPMPSYDPFNDLLSDMASYGCGSDPTTAGTVLALRDFDPFVARAPTVAYSLLDAFARQGRCALLDGHSMLCIVESGTHLMAVGGTPVVLADNRWVQ